MLADSDVWDEWAMVVGGLLSVDDAAARVGVDRATLQRATDAGELIAVADRRGRLVYPGCQFAHGWPAAELVHAWKRLVAAAISPWTACSWLVTADERLDGRSPVDYVRDGSATRLLAVARHDAVRLAQ